MFGRFDPREKLIAISKRLSTDEGTRKPAHYFDIYAKHLGAMASKPISILELGVYSGASLLIWREFFPNACIVGLDQRPMPERIRPQVERGVIHFVQGDQGAADDLKRCLALSASGRFDVVIDDCSHVGYLSRASFEFLLPHGLREGGLYFIEDYGTGYMPEFYDGGAYRRAGFAPEDRVFPSHNCGMVGWMKQLIDELHGPAIMPNEPNLLPIHSIEFHPSIAVVTRA